MTRRAQFLRAAFAGGILLVAGTEVPAGPVPSVIHASVATHRPDPTDEVVRREVALIEQLRSVSRSEVFYALIELAVTEPPGPLNEQLVQITQNFDLDPLHKAAWLLETLSVFIAGAERTVEITSPNAELGAVAPPPGPSIAKGYLQLQDRILRHLVDFLPPDVLDAFRERFAALACIDISRWRLEDFSSESYVVLGYLLEARPRDDHVRRMHSTLLDVHERLRTGFGERLLREMDAIEGRWIRNEISTVGRREAYRSILERVHREIARYKAVREIAFTLETRIDLQAPQRYYLRALGRAFEFDMNAGGLRSVEAIIELADVVTRHMAEWHTVSRLLFLTTMLREGPEGMHRWMYGTIDCQMRDEDAPARMRLSKNDRYTPDDCSCAQSFSHSPEDFAICCEAYKRRRFRTNWFHLEMIYQDSGAGLGSGRHGLGPARRDSVANLFAEAISSRIVTEHTDLISDVHRALRCLLDPNGSRSCTTSPPGAVGHLGRFEEKLREPAEGAVIAAAIGETIGAISLDPRMADPVKLEKIEQMAEMLVLIHTDEALETLLALFDHPDRGRVVSDRRNFRAALETGMVTKLKEFVEVDRLVDPERRRLTAEILDHLLMKCRELSVDPYGRLYDFRYIHALARIKAIQPRLRMDEDEVIERDDLINDIVTYHATNPWLFVSSVFHLSDLLMDLAEHWMFWYSTETRIRSPQAAEVFKVLSWVNSSLGRAEAESKVVDRLLSSDDVEEVRIVSRAYAYFATRTYLGRTTFARGAPPQFYEAVLPLMQRWLHMLPRHLVDRMRDRVIRPLTMIASRENSDALLTGDGREFLTEGIKAELELLVRLIKANHNEDRQDRALSAELKAHVERANQRRLREQAD